MKNFVYSTPTEIIFGRNALDRLPAEAAKLGGHALVIYGGGSVKRNGILDKVVSSLAGFVVTEMGGVEPNPRITTVEKGVALAKETRADFIIAVGGGSTIDCAKAIAGGVYYDGEAWDFMKDNSLFPKKALPLMTVLTLAATGSEMNGNFVISNKETNDKMACFSPFIIPKVSFMNPEFTFSVSKYQTACGVSDIMSHVFEVYFDPNKEAYVTDRLCEALLTTCIRYGKRAVDFSSDYEARSNLMWAGTLAINGLLKKGKSDVSWAVHGMEHQLSAYYDIAHGAGLAVLTPAWMRYVLDGNTAPKFADYARRVWRVEETDDMKAAAEGIERTARFFREIGMPSSITDTGIDSDRYFGEMAEKAFVNSDTRRAYVPLYAADIEKIYRSCYRL